MMTIQRGGVSSSTSTSPSVLLALAWCIGSAFQMGMYYQSIILNNDHHHHHRIMMINNDLITPTLTSTTTSSPKILPRIESNNNITATSSTLPANVKRFFPFTIRDARRLVPNQPPPSLEMNIFDYVDVTRANQRGSKTKAQLFLNARPIKKAGGYMMAPCQYYHLNCYRSKIIQVFRYVLENNPPQTEYFMYVEADNDLCLPLSDYETLALTEKRYFITVGIGFSGWIMHRSFVETFLDGYSGRGGWKSLESNHKIRQGPDIYGAYLLMQNNSAWSVTRKYLVSHTILPSKGSVPLTQKNADGQQQQQQQQGQQGQQGQPQKSLDEKHLPRCFEPRRAKWAISQSDPRDKHGWDYFDYEECPDSDFYPCKNNKQPTLQNNGGSTREPVEGPRRASPFPGMTSTTRD